MTNFDDDIDSKYQDSSYDTSNSTWDFSQDLLQDLDG